MRGVFSEFFLGVRLFARGFAVWGRRPKLMMIGALPPLIIGAIFLTVFIALFLNIDTIAVWLTGWASEWQPTWYFALRIGVSAAVLIGVFALGVLLFASITLALGSLFYEKIWRAVEDQYGGVPREVTFSNWVAVKKGIRDAIVLGATALGLGILVFLLGLVPFVGPVVGAITGAIIAGRALSIELTGFGFDARGISLGNRRRTLAARRALQLGFGIPIYLTFLIPGGAVLTMPAATAAGALLTRELLGELPPESPAYPLVTK
ncbi:EI24 domain-containing protein [Humidisolicoccus flavus]|uniref:EI24 domain-containing protein n=1 Tax=Humidisolicoccus flavus TaxID=3111414 RepID=UPI003250BED2